MVIIRGDDVKVDTCSIVTYYRKLQRTPKYIPGEIWFEIISRLPLKSLFVSRSVCKLWRNLSIILENKIYTNPLALPLCGLCLISFEADIDLCFSYICLRTKKRFSVRCGSAENNLIFPSGFERGLLNNFSFDFSMINKFIQGARKRLFNSFVLSGGLLLVTLDDGSSEVHNLTTKEICFVPKSRFMTKYGFDYHRGWEKLGFLIRSPSYPTKKKCRFTIIRFCMHIGIIEAYYSVTRRWSKYRLELGDEIMSSARLPLQNYVGFFDCGVLSVYVLTNKDRGIAIKFKNTANPKMKFYCFPLPEVARGGYLKAKIWECEKSLYLSYYNDRGLWIWKAGCTQVDSWTWVPMLEINPACQSIVCKDLFKAVLDASVRVMPLTFHPNDAVVYLLIKYSIFMYNLKTNTLDKIVDIEDHEGTSFYLAYAFKPCLSFMDAGNAN